MRYRRAAHWPSSTRVLPRSRAVRPVRGTPCSFAESALDEARPGTRADARQLPARVHGELEAREQPDLRRTRSRQGDRKPARRAASARRRRVADMFAIHPRHAATAICASRQRTSSNWLDDARRNSPPHARADRHCRSGRSRVRWATRRRPVFVAAPLFAAGAKTLLGARPPGRVAALALRPGSGPPTRRRLIAACCPIRGPRRRAARPSAPTPAAWAAGVLQPRSGPGGWAGRRRHGNWLGAASLAALGGALSA